MIPGNNGMFDSVTFLGQLIHDPGNGTHVALVLLSGFFNANGDFLCAVACSQLPGSVANLIYGGWGLIQGTLLTFLVEKYDGNLVFLFCGIGTATLGIISMSASDYYSEGPTTRTTISKLSMDFSSMQDHDYHAILVENREGEDQSGSDGQKVVRTYIYLCLFAGVMTGLFVPLSVLAGKGDGAVDNPYVLMFLFQVGELSAIPFMIFYFSRLFASGARNDVKGSITQYLDAVLHLPKQDFRYGCCAGLAVGMGFFLFFSASDVLPSTISFGISNCAPLVTILIDVVVFEHLKHATVLQTRFMILSAILFVGAISQMIIAQAL